MGFLNWLLGSELAFETSSNTDEGVKGLSPSSPSGSLSRSSNPNPGTPGAALPSDPIFSGAAPSPSEALSLSAVYRAVDLRATAARQLTLDAWRGADQIAPKPLLIRQPDAKTSLPIFLEQTVVSLNLRGNAYWRKHRNSAGEVTSLEVLNPGDVLINTSASGRVLSYQYRGFDIPAKDVQHLSKLRIPGSPYGLGPIQAMKSELRGALDLRDYASNWTRSGDVPSGVLKSDQVLTPDLAQATKEQWRESRGGTRDVAVLGAGLDYSPIALTPEEAQWLESQRFGVEQVARAFGIPAGLMGSIGGSSNTYSNIQDAWREFVRFGLTSDLSEIEDALSQIMPRGTSVRFNLDAVLRSDTKQRYEAHKIALDAGFLTVDEVRDIEGLSPLNSKDNDE